MSENPNLQGVAEPRRYAFEPDPPGSGIYRHYKGPLYLVIGAAHDANADTLRVLNEAGAHEHCSPLGEREVVVYVPLMLDDAHAGLRMAVRTLEDFEAVVCTGEDCSRYGRDVRRAMTHEEYEQCARQGHHNRRFTAVGARYVPRGDR